MSANPSLASYTRWKISYQFLIPLVIYRDAEFLGTNFCEKMVDLYGKLPEKSNKTILEAVVQVVF